ncbi:hypothetical protein MAPG_06108 [Magnaporthiopsis poae ATCC 64411]|uniref:Uncharacterized protein n=1 Tax=Magnaporthiopsis poae (strain ATCC 64411 / 73-15) TaxID=644358 RepID=A0A0C4E159_MAGP6|nr:hypothetical protein MAPG_06108 [Magnaporthiopsis poae ATCC 64411]
MLSCWYLAHTPLTQNPRKRTYPSAIPQVTTAIPSEAFYFGFSHTPTEEVTDVVGELVGSAPMGHNPTPDLIGGLLAGYDENEVDDKSLLFIFARSRTNDKIVGVLVLWRLTRPGTAHPMR